MLNFPWPAFKDKKPWDFFSLWLTNINCISKNEVENEALLVTTGGTDI